MNFYLLNYFLVRQTDRQKAIHKTTLCISIGGPPKKKAVNKRQVYGNVNLVAIMLDYRLQVPCPAETEIAISKC